MVPIATILISFTFNGTDETVDVLQHIRGRTDALNFITNFKATQGKRHGYVEGQNQTSIGHSVQKW